MLCSKYQNLLILKETIPLIIIEKGNDMSQIIPIKEG